MPNYPYTIVTFAGILFIIQKHMFGAYFYIKQDLLNPEIIVTIINVAISLTLFVTFMTLLSQFG